MVFVLRVMWAGRFVWKRLMILSGPVKCLPQQCLLFKGEDGRRVDNMVKVAIESPLNRSALVAVAGWLSIEDYKRWASGCLMRIHQPIAAWVLPPV